MVVAFYHPKTESGSVVVDRCAEPTQEGEVWGAGVVGSGMGGP